MNMTAPTPTAPATTSKQTAEEVLFEGRTALLPGLGALLISIITLGLGLIYYALRRLGTHYRITTQRVVVETGVFSKKLDQIDIYRINDYVVERPFGQRLLGTGNLVIEAMDRTTPVVRLEALKTDVVALYEKLRVATEAEKRRRGVRVLDVEAQ
jgi:uncharacterized membrane protein YdbT with pleckstrin-like domain